MAGLLVGLGVSAQDFTLVTLDPGHFHAALFQREMLPGVAEEALVYAPLGPDLVSHLGRVAAFNARPQDPTRWRLRVYAGPDFMDRLLAEPRGQIVVLSGRNRGKIERIRACLDAGRHVLADKPWIIEAADLPRLEAALDAAADRGVVGYDAMTQRFEITALVQRALVNDSEVFGTVIPGSVEEPAVTVESLHYLFKEVDGAPNLRPPWFFDVGEQGEGLTDVGTHLADMVFWVLFPKLDVDYRTEIEVLRGRHWPTTLSLAQYRQVTGQKELPAAFRSGSADRVFDYYCNNTVDYAVRGIHTRLQATWEFVAPAGRKDAELTVFRGSRARVEVRQDPEDQHRREVYVVPNPGTERDLLQAALQRRLAGLAPAFDGLALEPQPGRFRIVIPDLLRATHEQHFARVVERFLAYARDPGSLPAGEKRAMLAKYFVTTRGVALARQAGSAP